MYTTVWEGNGVWQHFYGSVTGQERLSGLSAMLDDAQIVEARYIIIDFTGMTDIAIAESEMETLLVLMNTTLASANPDVVLVYVVNGRPAQAYLQRTLQIGPLRNMQRVCHTLAEARGWIASQRGG